MSGGLTPGGSCRPDPLDDIAAVLDGVTGDLTIQARAAHGADLTRRIKRHEAEHGQSERSRWLLLSTFVKCLNIPEDKARDLVPDAPDNDPQEDTMPTETTDTLEFDTARIDTLIDEFDAAIHRVTNKDVTLDPGGRARHNDPNKAEVSRELLRAADVARQLACEVQGLYWQLKGMPVFPEHDDGGDA